MTRELPLAGRFEEVFYGLQVSGLDRKNVDFAFRIKSLRHAHCFCIRCVHCAAQVQLLRFPDA